MVRNFRDLVIQVSNINEEQDSTRNQIAGILKTLSTGMNTLLNDTISNSQKTLDVQNLLSRCGDIPRVISQHARGSCGAIAND